LPPKKPPFPEEPLLRTRGNITLFFDIPPAKKGSLSGFFHRPGAKELTPNTRIFPPSPVGSNLHGGNLPTRGGFLLTKSAALLRSKVPRILTARGLISSTGEISPTLLTRRAIYGAPSRAGASALHSPGRNLFLRALRIYTGARTLPRHTLQGGGAGNPTPRRGAPLFSAAASAFC